MFWLITIQALHYKLTDGITKEKHTLVPNSSMFPVDSDTWIIDSSSQPTKCCSRYFVVIQYVCVCMLNW